MKNKSTAAILAFFLGGIGMHRFYLNQTGLGFLYLIFCWTLIPCIIAFVDFIIFLTMSDESFNKKYNAAATTIMNTPNNHGSISDELEKLHTLKEKGIITEAEFRMKKSKML
jgi:TM2 domain-containing membrane protein YozV